MASSNTPLMSENPPPYAATAPAGAVPSYGAAPSGAVPGYGAAPAGAVPGYGAAHMEQPPTVPKSAPAGAYTDPYQGAPGQPHQNPQVPIGQQPSYAQPQTTVYVQPQPQVVFVGGCPACRVGVLEDDFTCLGVCCAIFFFPLGILCCLAMRQRRCPNCGAVFG